jgi:uncharacterized protein DUF3253
MVPSGVRFAIRPVYPPPAAGYTQLSAAPSGAQLQADTGGASTHPASTICPSEAARAVDPQGWRELMPAARAAAGRLAAAGQVEVTQRGEVVDVATARGPVRVRRRH